VDASALTNVTTLAPGAKVVTLAPGAKVVTFPRNPAQPADFRENTTNMAPGAMLVVFSI